MKQRKAVKIAVNGTVRLTGDVLGQLRGDRPKRGRRHGLARIEVSGCDEAGQLRFAAFV